MSRSPASSPTLVWTRRNTAWQNHQLCKRTKICYYGWTQWSNLGCEASFWFFLYIFCWFQILHNFARDSFGARKKAIKWCFAQTISDLRYHGEANGMPLQTALGHFKTGVQSCKLTSHVLYFLDFVWYFLMIWNLEPLGINKLKSSPAHTWSIRQVISIAGHCLWGWTPRSSKCLRTVHTGTNEHEALVRFATLDQKDAKKRCAQTISVHETLHAWIRKKCHNYI